MENLPTEIILQIIDKLDTNDLVKLSRTSKSFHYLLSQDKYWNKIFDNFLRFKYKHFEQDYDTLQIRLQKKRIKKLPLRIRLGKTLNGNVCKKCFCFTFTKSSCKDRFEKTFQRTWCLNCWKDNTITKTQTHSLLQSCNIPKNKRDTLLENLLSVTCAMNGGVTGTYYLTSQVLPLRCTFE